MASETFRIFHEIKGNLSKETLLDASNYVCFDPSNAPISFDPEVLELVFLQYHTLNPANIAPSVRDDPAALARTLRRRTLEYNARLGRLFTQNENNLKIYQAITSGSCDYILLIDSHGGQRWVYKNLKETVDTIENFGGSSFTVCREAYSAAAFAYLSVPSDRRYFFPRSKLMVHASYIDLPGLQHVTPYRDADMAIIEKDLLLSAPMQLREQFRSRLSILLDGVGREGEVYLDAQDLNLFQLGVPISADFLEKMKLSVEAVRGTFLGRFLVDSH